MAPIQNQMENMEEEVFLLLLNLNPVHTTYGKLYSLFQTFGQVISVRYNAGDTYGYVKLKGATQATYAFKALDGADLWDRHLSVRFVPSDDLSLVELVRFESDIKGRGTAWTQQQQQQQQKRKLEKEKEEEEMKKRQKASNTSASLPSDDPLKSGPFGSLLDSIDRNLLATLTTGPDTSGSQPDSAAESVSNGYDYDVIVIGGGSGGLAAAKEAAALGAKVACLDYVKPSPQGTAWKGLGGTCVNVGCIPKKLMHQAGLLGRALDDARKFGWDTPKNAEISWKKLVSVIEKELGYRHYLHEAQLQEPKVDYFNGFAEFVNVHRIKATDAIGQVKELTSKYFIIATGARPKYPVIPGIKEYCISSDDLFSLSYCPGKTLVIGASYVSLECAGFLRALGLDVTVMVRSILLRGFDQEMAKFIGAYMQNEGIKFVRPCVPTKVEMLREGRPGRYRVTATAENGMQRIDTYNTVLVAVGRDPCTSELHLENVGVTVNSSGFIICSDDESTTCPSIFAIGDVVEGRPKLTPVAIRAGKLLAKRLFGESELKCEYENVPTTVFTPLEYGCVGLSEEEAIAKYGADSVEIYHSHFTPLEWTVPHHQENACYAKLICISSENEKVVGLHVLGPNAGEVTQGWAVGIKLGATKSDFDNAIGIHPTCAEVFTTLTVTKRSGKGIEASGC